MREFVEALHNLYNVAGQPGARIISQRIRQNRELRETVSHETISALLRGNSLPGWAKVRSIIVVLHQESDNQPELNLLLEELQRLWLAVRGSNSTRPDQGTPADNAPTGRADPVTGNAGQLVPEPVGGRERDNTTGLHRGSHQLARPLTRLRSETTSRHKLTAPRQPRPAEPIVGGLPSRHPSFVGREALLDNMRALLVANPHAPLALYGLGGAGKTQLAREYVGRNGEEYAVVWWVPADRVERARTSLLGLAERLQIPTQGNAEQTVAGLLGRLESQQLQYLLIFDGLEDDSVRSFIPTIGGHVILTSRNPALANDSSYSGLEVPDFDRVEAIQFLRGQDGQLTGEQADALADKLGRLPLALEQITALRQATGLSWEDLVTQLDEPGRGLLSTGRPSHYPHSIAASLQIAMKRLNAANPVAALAFELFAWFGSEPVSIALLRGGRTGDVSAPLARALRDPVQLNKAIMDISRYGLARLSSKQRIEVQPSIRLALRDALPAEFRTRAQRNVHEILAAADPGWPDDLVSSNMHREMAAHVLPAGLIQSKVEAVQSTVINQIRFRYIMGDYADACRLGQAAVTTWREDNFLGQNHILVLRATREWANALRSTGRYERSHELTADAVSRLRSNPEYGEDDQHTLAMTTSLAADLRIAGKYREALATDEDNHRRYTTRFGDNSRHTAISHHNLAVSLRLVGDFLRAHTVDQIEFDRLRTARGEENTRLLLTVNALSEDLYGLGRFAEALDLQLTYLDTGQQLLGPTHPGILRAERTIALARRGVGDVTQATDSLRANYYRCIESLGPDHEYALAAAMSYANALRDHGQTDEAYVHATDAVSSYRRTFGQRNPLTLAAEVNLASILRAQGERNRARQIDTMAREALLGAIGDRHPYSITVTANLATDLCLAGDHAGALRLSEQAHAAAVEVRGPEHCDTLAVGANLALDRRAAGATYEAEVLFGDVLTTIRRTLGPAHPMAAQVVGGGRVECVIEPPSA
jgi:tetratricopeptide (TPR) repeat protein